MVTAAVVAFIRKLFTKADKPMIDGRPAVFALAAFVAFLVIVWAQLRAGGLDWTRLLIDWPVVFGLAVGGTTWLQKLRRDGLYTDLDSVEVQEVVGSVDLRTQIEKLTTDLNALKNAAGGTVLINGTVEMSTPKDESGEEIVP